MRRNMLLAYANESILRRIALWAAAVCGTATAGETLRV